MFFHGPTTVIVFLSPKIEEMMSDPKSMDVLDQERAVSPSSTSSTKSDQTNLPTGENGENSVKIAPADEAVVIAPVKKSWAAMVKPADDGKSQQQTSAAPVNMMAFVQTSEENRRRKDQRKCERLGEVMFSRGLLERKLDHRTLFLTPRGMINVGNTCYMNAVLQTLMFCPPFFHLLEALDISGEGQTSELPPIVSCFVELTRCFQRIRNKSHLRTEDAPLDPTFVYETLAEYATTKSHQQMLSRGTQEDAQESLNHILLLLHEEMVRGIASLTESSTKELTARRAAGSSDEWTSISKGQKKSVIRECDDYRESPLTYVFGGKLRSVRMNNKGAKSAENVEPFFMLDLPIQDRSVTNVFRAIERFMDVETIHGYQNTAGVAVAALRHFRFEEVPAVLILHLSFFEYSSLGGLAKLQKDVSFDSTLRLPDRWFAYGHYNPARSFYRLSSVIFHYGEGTDGGHYTACFFHPYSPTQWIEANDSVISVVSFDYIRQPQYHRVPYLLFYRLQEQ